MHQPCSAVRCYGCSSQCYRPTVALLIATVVLLVTASTFISPTMFRYPLARSRPPDWANGSASLEVEPSGLLVDTPSCRIPDFDAYNPNISPYIRDPDPRLLVCNHSLPISVTDGQYIRLNTTLVRSLSIHYCLYQQVRFHSLLCKTRTTLLYGCPSAYLKCTIRY